MTVIELRRILPPPVLGILPELKQRCLSVYMAHSWALNCLVGFQYLATIYIAHHLALCCFVGI